MYNPLPTLLFLFCPLIGVVLPRVSVTGGGKAECLSCGGQLEVDGCGYVSADLSPGSSYYLLACLGPHVPTYTLVSVRTSAGEPTASIIAFEKNPVLALAHV